MFCEHIKILFYDKLLNEVILITKDLTLELSM